MTTGTLSSSVEMLQQICDAFNRHDLDAIMEHFADDCVLETPRGPEPWGLRYEGKDQVRTGLAGRFETIPDVHYGDDRHWVCGDTFGVSEWTLTGTSTAGEQLNVHGCDLWTLRDGKVVKKDSFWKIIDK